MSVFILGQSFGQTGGSPATQSAAEDQDYTFAYGLFQDKLYQLALEQLDSFLQKYPSSIRRPDALFLKAECSYDLGQYHDGIAGYEMLIREFPKGSLADDAFFRIGQSYIALDRPADAVRPLKTVIDQFPQSPLTGEASYWIGEAYSRQHEPDNAIKYFTLSYEHFGNNPYRDFAVYGIGWTHQSAPRYADAITWYRTLIDSFPKSTLAGSARLRLAECRFGMNDNAQALKELTADRAAFTTPADAGHADFLIAEARYRLNDFAGARDAYAAFLKAFPDHALKDDGTYGLAWSCMKLGQYDSAAVWFADVAKGPGPLAHVSAYRRGSALRLAGKDAEAAKAFEQTIRAVPNGEWTDNALLDLAEIQSAANDLAGARASLERVVNEFPSGDVRADALRLLGEVILRQGDPSAAQKRFAEASAIPGSRPEVKIAAEFQSAWASFKAGSMAEASKAFAAFAVTYPQHPKALEATYWQAEAEYRRGDFTKALELYRTVGAVPGTKQDDAIYGAGWSLTKLSKYSDAADEFERLIKRAPRGPLAYDARLRQADAWFAMKDYARAGAAYRTVIRLNPDSSGNDYAMYQAAQCSFRSNDFAEAYRQFSELVRLLPKSALADDAQYAMGWVNFQRKEYAEAIKEFQKVVRNYPTAHAAPRAFYSLGDAYYNLQQYPAAEAAYREVIRRFPDSKYVADAMTGIQYCLVAQGKAKEAATAIDAYVKDNPGSAASRELALKKADLLFGQKQYAAAATEYRSYLAAYPESPNRGQAFFWLGRSLVAQANTAEALAAFESAAGLKGSFQARALLEAVELYGQSKNVDKVNELLASGEKMFAADGSVMPEILYSKGRWLFTAGKSDEARQAWESASQRYPTADAADRARVGLATLALASGKPDQARVMAAQVATSRTDEIGAEAQCVVGDAYAAAKDWKQSITAYLKVRYVYPNQTLWIHRSLLGLGKAYRGSGDMKKARESLRDLISRKPSAVIAGEAEEVLKELDGQ